MPAVCDPNSHFRAVADRLLLPVMLTVAVDYFRRYSPPEG